MPTGPVKIAVLGGGYGAKVPLPVLSDLEEFEPVAVWSRTPERAAELADKHGLELGTSDVDELLAHPGLEAVHVATPVATHAEIAIAAARRGLHVLVDKPVAMDLAEARAVRDAIAEAGVVGAVNYGRRFQAHARAPAGARRRGRRRAADGLDLARLRRPRRARLAPVHLGPGRAARRRPAAGLRRPRPRPPARTRSARSTRSPPRPRSASRERKDADGTPHTVTAEDAYVILIRFRGGGLGQVSLTATARHKRGDVIEVYGAEGTVRLDADKRLHWGRAGEELQVEGPLKADSKQAYARVARSFHAAIRDGAAPEPGLEEGLRVQALLDAVRRAHAERRWVEPEPV